MNSTEYTGRKPDRMISYRNSAKAIELATRFEREQGEEWWTISNSPLLPGKWTLRDHKSIQVSFEKTLLDKNIKEYIEGVLVGKRGSAIGVSLGGSASDMFSGFSSGFFEETFGVSLVDSRSKFVKNEDEKRSHTVISGNLLDAETDDKILGKLNGRKVDLVVERMANGLGTLPRDPYLFASHLSRWYSRLSNPGLIFVQWPTFMDPLVVSWVNLIRENPSSGIEVAFDPRTEGDLHRALRIRKLPGAPIEIPLLTPREVKKAYEEAA